LETWRVLELEKQITFSRKYTKLLGDVASIQLSRRLKTYLHKTYIVMFQNRMLETMYTAKRQEVAGGWRNLHDEALHDAYGVVTVIGRAGGQRENRNSQNFSSGT
jgi:hypothetical protein